MLKYTHITWKYEYIGNNYFKLCKQNVAKFTCSLFSLSPAATADDAVSLLVDNQMLFRTRIFDTTYYTVHMYTYIYSYVYLII